MTRLTRLAAVLLVPVLLLAACGESPAKAKDTPSVSQPTGNVNIPSGVTLTKPGLTLKYGEPATIAYEPNPQRSSVLELTVLKVLQGKVADLNSYVLDARTQASNVYYVQVSVKNVGDGDVGRTPIPLWLVDNTNTLIQQSTFTNNFTKCPSTALPTTFPPNAHKQACLVYLVPDHGTITGVSFRPLQAFAPIEWHGDLTKPVVKKKTKKKS